jgi:hypothetical protein
LRDILVVFVLSGIPGGIFALIVIVVLTTVRVTESCTIFCIWTGGIPRKEHFIETLQWDDGGEA